MSRFNLPDAIQPEDFFSRWLPKEAGRLGLSAAGGIDVHVRVELAGEGGGAWDLHVKEGKLEVGKPSGGEPQVTVHQSVADWRALLVGEGGDTSLAPPQASPTDLLFLDPMARQVLQTSTGTLEFCITGYRERTWVCRVKFGTQPMPAEPDATITVDAETYAAIAARKMQPPEAYFNGKVQIGGDTGLAMQVGMALLPRFQ